MAPLRVLLTRLSHIGDCLHALPLLDALTRHIPEIEITWVVEQPTDQLLRGHSLVAELCVLPRRWYRAPGALARLGRTLRRRRFDAALDPQSLTKSAVLGWLAGARQRIGFARPVGREASPWLNNALVAPQRTHVVDRYRELLAPLGVALPDAVRFPLPDYPEAREFVDHCLTELHLQHGYAVINPGAGWQSRIWDPVRYGAVARHLGVHHNLPALVVWAGSAERAMAETIVEHGGGHAVLAPATNLRALAEVVRRARLFVGSDTGPLHLAAAYGTPCVSLHGTTRREVSGPYGTQHAALQTQVHDGTSRERRSAGNDAMLAILAADVAHACSKLLASSRADDAMRAA